MVRSGYKVAQTHLLLTTMVSASFSWQMASVSVTWLEFSHMAISHCEEGGRCRLVVFPRPGEDRLVN